jgi:hypothetical protein
LEFHLRYFFIIISFHTFYKESYQEDLNGFSHAEGLDKILVSIFPLEEVEVVKPCEEVINSIDVNEFMEQPSNTVENHIDDFICVQKRGWDVGCFGFDGNPI